MRAFEHMSSPLRILLVDDDPFTLTMLSTALSSLGFTEVTSAQSASAAIALAQHVQPQSQRMSNQGLSAHNNNQCQRDQST
jgi:CheY-like chemotaxis protein